MFLILNKLFFVLFIIILIFSIYMQIKIKLIYNKYNKIINKKGITGIDFLIKIQNNYDMENYKFILIKGDLCDYCDFKKKIIALSENIGKKASITSIAVAAHEMGHAIQYVEKNWFLNFRNTMFPVLQFSSRMAIPLLLLGFIFNSLNLIFFGIILYSFLILFQIIIIPVEINASNIGIELIREGKYLTENELIFAKKVLKAAALTYIITMILGMIQLLRFILIFLGAKD